MRLRKIAMPFATALVFLTQPVRAETLYDAMRDAYYFNPSVEAARANLRALGENVPIAEAGRLPTLAITAEQQFRQSLSNPATGVSRATSPLTGGLQGQVSLYDGGLTANQVSQAEADVEAGYAQLSSTEQQILLSAVEVFFNVLRDHEIRELTRRNLSNLQEELEASKIRFEVGEVTLTDVAQAESSVAAANANVVQAEGNLRASAAQYRAIVGRLPTKLEPPETLPDLPVTLAAAETDAIATQPSIRAARAAERSALYAIRAAMAGKLPTVDLLGSLTGTLDNGLLDDSFLSSGDESDARAQVGLTLNFNAPIYQGGRVDASVRQARFRASEARSNYHDAVRIVQQNVNVSWQTLVTARGSIEANQLRVRAARIAFEGISEELRVGSRATIDVLDAEEALLDAQIALVQAVRGLNVAAYSLLASMGRLDPESIGLKPAVDASTDPSVLSGTVSYDYPLDSSTAWRFPWRP